MLALVYICNLVDRGNVMGRDKEKLGLTKHSFLGDSPFAHGPFGATEDDGCFVISPYKMQ